MNNKPLLFVLLLFAAIQLVARHPFRLTNSSFPHVTAQWPDGSNKSSITNRYIRYYPLFAFNLSCFEPYLLPNDAILFANDSSKSVKGSILASFIEEVIEEVLRIRKKRKRNKILNHFIILQDKNFNYRRSCGLIVLAFKDYPFVVKLFIEKPNTILDFHATGLEPIFFFHMGGGSNRHLSGFTRLTNHSFVTQRIAQFPQWAHHVELPRKWFWLPRNQKNIVITGNNIGDLPEVTVEFPSIYAVIADKIDFSQQTQQLSSQTKGEIIMQLCNDLDLNIDPHSKNFAFTQDSLNSQFKITLVDTEHFPTMVGDIQTKPIKTHQSWYLFLAGKCFKDMYLTTKREALLAGRESAQQHQSFSTPPIHHVMI